VTDRVITLTGPPGSGKSTAGRIVAKRLGLEFLSAGELFRAEAKRQGMDVEEFSRYAETHEGVDRGLDDEMASRALPGRLLDGRLVGAFCRRHGVPCHYLVVTASEVVRFRRLAGRDDLSLSETTSRTLAREQSERDRYQRYYGIDLDDEVPDLSVDSSTLTPEAVADQLIAFLRSHDRKKSP
jgi:cytidylate kinase